MSSSKTIDYSLYLVTGRELLPPGKPYLESLEESLQGGVTVVQIREKNTDTAEFIQIALDSQAICKRYNVPILINDRIDVALAIQADGVHLGQTDMPVSIARKLLPKGCIIGVSCNNKEEVETAAKENVDYVGIGAVWGTNTKSLTSPIIGVRGVGELLQKLDGSGVKAVAIGGIKSTNALRTLHGSVSTTGHRLDGIAVVSDIVGSNDPKSSARKLSCITSSFISSFNFNTSADTTTASSITAESLKISVSNLLDSIKSLNPLIHQITNTVVTNQSANATLALGASPIMATAPQEMADLSLAIGSLLVNFGTIADKEGMLRAGQCANLNRKPVVFDPVGVGATSYRRNAANELLNAWQASVIKGNAGELAALANSQEVKAKGVDSDGAGFADPAAFVKQLALQERCVIILTGRTDWVSDGKIVVKLDNGHKLLGNITGSGCMLGTCVATFCAAASATAQSEEGLVGGDMVAASVGGVLALTVASELAASRSDVHGSGTFLPALIDELYNLTAEGIRAMAKIELV